MWRSQLYLFWLTSVVKPRRGNQESDTHNLADQHWQPAALVDVELTLSWGEYFGGKWTSPKSTNMRKPLVIRGIDEYHPEQVVLAARTETPPNVTERLIVSLVYFNKDYVKAYKVTFTSKNVGPLVDEDDPDFALRVMDVFYQQQFWDPHANATLDAASLDVNALDLTLRVAQPDTAATPTIDELVLTKKLNHAGYNLRTVMHPVENQWEAPYLYADEHSTFVVQPDERFVSYWDHIDYVPILFDPVVVDVPPLREQVTIPDPRDPIWNPPWADLVNPNLKAVVGNTDVFDFGGATFGALGLMR